MKRTVHGRAVRVLALALACTACASSYSSLRFAPAVQDVDLRADSGAVEARLLVAWRGIGGDGGEELRFRVRVENPGFLPFTLAPAEFELLDGALQTFGPARAEVPVAVEAGGTQTFELAFRAPGGLAGFDLSSLTLRVRFQGGRWSWSASFTRTARAPDHDPYWEWGYGVRLGATWSHG